MFAKKNFAGAYKKYSEALKHASNNPVLYSNRAACCLSLNRYVCVSTQAGVNELINTRSKIFGCICGRHESEVILHVCVSRFRRLMRMAGNGD